MTDKLIIFDTTLRDGEQSPGASMSVEQKVEVAEALERLGVNRIEAGFPVSSPVQFQAVKLIGEKVKKSTIVGLARCNTRDIDAVRDSLANCPNRMIHIFLATSDIHMEYKLRMSREEVLASIEKHVIYSRKQGFDLVEFSPEDATRTDPDFLIKALKVAVAAGANTLNVPDTVGYATPEDYGAIMEKVCQTIPGIGNSVVLSAHCHNDLGLAVANSLAAIKAGARQAEVTLNGIGERAGNTPMEELVMTIEVRKDVCKVSTDIVQKYLYPTGRLIQTITGLIVPRNKPIFGDNVFSHEAGIHQHGVIRNRSTYEIMDPTQIGRSRETLVMGRHSGKHAIEKKLEQYNIVLNAQQLEELSQKFTVIADKKKEVYDEDLLSLVSGILSSLQTGWKMIEFQTWTGNRLIPSATVKMSLNDEVVIGTDVGDGPVDAIFKAVDKCTGVKGNLQEYVIQAVARGKDAQGQVKLRVGFGGGPFVDGKASSTDIVEASALAYINAFNRNELMKENKNASWEAGEKC